MRIISGQHKGRVITPPKNLRARPTTDFAKENIFNVLNNMVDFEDLDVLDLFSGTGSISYEFASRGVKSVLSVEVNNVHHNYIRQMIKELNFDNMHAIKANVFLYLKSCSKKFDMIFSDAPYDLANSEDVIELVFSEDLLNDDGILVFEHSKDKEFSKHPKFYNSKAYGSVNFSLFKK